MFFNSTWFLRFKLFFTQCIQNTYTYTQYIERKYNVWQHITKRKARKGIFWIEENFGIQTHFKLNIYIILFRFVCLPWYKYTTYWNVHVLIYLFMYAMYVMGLFPFLFLYIIFNGVIENRWAVFTNAKKAQSWLHNNRNNKKNVETKYHIFSSSL